MIQLLFCESNNLRQNIIRRGYLEEREDSSLNPIVLDEIFLKDIAQEHSILDEILHRYKDIASISEGQAEYAKPVSNRIATDEILFEDLYRRKRHIRRNKMSRDRFFFRLAETRQLVSSSGKTRHEMYRLSKREPSLVRTNRSSRAFDRETLEMREICHEEESRKKRREKIDESKKSSSSLILLDEVMTVRNC